MRVDGTMLVNHDDAVPITTSHMRMRYRRAIDLARLSKFFKLDLDASAFEEAVPKRRFPEVVRGMCPRRSG